MGDVIRSGRRFVFTKPDELKNKIQSYFDNCDPHKEKRLVESGVNAKGDTIFAEREIMTEQIPYTITGLALHLGVSRNTLLNYRDPEHYTEEIDEETRNQIMDAIEEAYQRVEEFNERQLHVKGIAPGVKFNLTNNFGWVDKQVVDNNNRDIASVLDNLENTDQSRTELAAEAQKELNKEAPHEEKGPAPTE